MATRASVSHPLAAVSTSAHGATCQFTVPKGRDARGALQRALKSTDSALCVRPIFQAASAARRMSQAARPQQCRSIPLAIMDTAPEWTLDQIAGLAFGFVLLASVLLAYKVDEAIARSQRRDLGLCEECGGLFEARNCKEKRCPLRDETDGTRGGTE